MHRAILWLLFGLFAPLAPGADGDGAALMARGKLLYLQHCVVCHGGSGQGTPGTFPPIANSDYLMAKVENGIRPIVEGLSGRITVNGTSYNNTMPPILLNDDEVAAVVSFVRNTWGNRGEMVTPAQVAEVRRRSRYPTYEKLQAAASYAPLPRAPEGFSIREVAKFTENPLALATRPGARDVYVLSEPGNVWRVEPGGRMTQVLKGETYLEPQRGRAATWGFCFDKSGRLWITSNRRLDSRPFVTNEVTIYRSANAQQPFAVEAYLRVLYPWGIGPFNHGASHIAEGPDGFMYVANGARTDGNEPGRAAEYFTGGELENTACLWRIDSTNAAPPEVFARGLRNPFGFCWDAAGTMFATENGPDAHMPEELNVITRGAHYGFPFQFGSGTDKPYAHTPDAPAGLRITLPVVNLGPAGGAATNALSTFDPHSSPAGIIYCDERFPEPVRGTLLVTRFGNLLKLDRDAGFDVLQMRVRKTAAGYQAETTAWLAPLARPIDIAAVGTTIYVLEYTRTLNNRGDVPMLPGRLLALTPRVQSTAR